MKELQHSSVNVTLLATKTDKKYPLPITKTTSFEFIPQNIGISVKITN